MENRISFTIYFHSPYHSYTVINNDLLLLYNQAKDDGIILDTTIKNIDFFYTLTDIEYLIEVEFNLIDNCHQIPDNKLAINKFISTRIDYYCRDLDLKFSYIDNVTINNDKTNNELITNLTEQEQKEVLNHIDNEEKRPKEKLSKKRRIFIIDDIE